LKRFSIIIPNLNSVVIDRVLKALHIQTVDPSLFEVLVVGTDSPGLVELDHLVRFIPTDDKVLAPVKRNLGMDSASGEIFVFLDSDCIPRPDWLAWHLDRHDAGEVIVGGSVTFATNNYFQLADNVSAFHDLLPHMPAGRKSYLATANLSIRRSVVAVAGKMLPNLNRAHDLEWTVRFRKMGYSLYFEPRAIIDHDPPRKNICSVWRHWHDDAPDTLWVRLKYPKLLQTPSFAGYRWLYFCCAPLIAAWATIYTFEHNQTRRNYWRTAPLVYLTKLVWCWSAFQRFPGTMKPI